MDVASYMRNPVVLWAHDSGQSWGASPSGGIPIARTLSLEKDEGGIVASFEFLAGDAFAQRVRNAWEQGFLNAASIGWISHEHEAIPGSSRGRRHTKTELVEWSIVPVPADVGATRSGYADVLRSLGLAPLPSGVSQEGKPTEETAISQAAKALRKAVKEAANNQ